MKSMSRLPWYYLQIYVYLKDEDTKKQFITDAVAQGYHFSDYSIISKESDCCSYYRIMPDLTIRDIVGWAGNMMVKNLPLNEVDNCRLLIDYKHFLSFSAQNAM
ncbi:MAG: hypothetical protein IJZ33_02805 [Clostridia bacterium]|nr:hypothetical protein [Clostridia bacterium]